MNSFRIQLPMTMSLGICPVRQNSPRGRNALRHHHWSVVLFGLSGYRGVAAMIACAWVEPLTGTDENTCDNTEEVPVVKMRLTAVSWS
jgi:hypothetical protein